MRVLLAIAIAVVCFSTGAYYGWDSGMRDTKNMYSCTNEK
jgi:hypothetical protein